MTWDQMLTWLVIPTVVGGTIAYVVVRLWSGAPWTVSRRNRGQSSSHEPDVWRDPTEGE